MRTLMCLLLALFAGSREHSVRVNQLGYYLLQEKVAVMEGVYAGAFELVDTQTGKPVYSAPAGEIRNSPFSEKQRTILDFSSFREPGNYVICVNGTEVSPHFVIGQGVLNHLADAALDAFILHRSTPGHPDTHVLVHASAATESRPEGTVISSPGGWYDAGDYNKYIVNSAFTTGLVLAACEQYPGNKRNKAILDEMLYNLKWSMTMQDPNDGGVYHKLTTPNFEGFIKPSECRQTRYVVQKSVTASLDFAASMAQASRIYRTMGGEYFRLAAKMLEASKKAYTWSLNNPNALYNQFALNGRYKPGINTGAYGDFSAADEWFWAACELFITTGEPLYYDKILECKPDSFRLPVWGNVAALGSFALFTNNKALSGMKEELLSFCDSIAAAASGSVFACGFGNKTRDFYWGCLSESCCGQGIALLYAYRLSGNESYRTAAHQNMDYILGRNSTGYCYVTGMGSKSPANPHHRLAATDDIPGPLKGFLIGGPNPARQDGCEYPSLLPDESYADIIESYASNEIAINWNASLLHLALGLSYLQDPGT